MKNVTLCQIMLPNIPSYCGSLGYFLDHEYTLNFTYLTILALALPASPHIANKSLWYELN